MYLRVLLVCLFFCCAFWLSHETLSFGTWFVCVCVCPSVTALAASASAYTCSQRCSGVCLRLFLDIYVWIFKKKLPFKSYGVKNPTCKCVRAHRQPFLRTFGTNEGQQLPEAQRVGRMLLQRLATGPTSIKQARYKQLTTRRGYEGHVRACVVYRIVRQ